MQPVSARFLDAIRHPSTILSRVEVWFGGARVDTYGAAGIPVYGGEVDVDPTKQVRRSLTNVKVDATDEMWNLLSPVGTELRVFRGFRYFNGESDVVPLGRFVVPNLTETYGGDWSGQIGSAPDLMIKMQQKRFTTPRGFVEGFLIKQLIEDLLEEVFGSGTVNMLASSYALTTSPLVEERDRAGFIGKLCDSIGAQVFIAPDGTPTVADKAQLAPTPVWTIDAGPDGVLYQAGRERNYDRTYSGVVVVPTQIDGIVPFAPVTLWDEDPASPTYFLGPFGQVPYFMTSPLIADVAQAQAAARARLPYVTAPRAQLTIEAECNPALMDGDTVSVVLPPRQRGGQRVTERHLVGAFTIPLTADGTQSISTVSSVADVEDSL